MLSQGWWNKGFRLEVERRKPPQEDPYSRCTKPASTEIEDSPWLSSRRSEDPAHSEDPTSRWVANHRSVRRSGPLSSWKRPSALQQRVMTRNSMPRADGFKPPAGPYHSVVSLWPYSPALWLCLVSVEMRF